MCTHNQCFEQKLEKYYNFSSENQQFCSREILLYIAWACLRNVSQLLVIDDSTDTVPTFCVFRKYQSICNHTNFRVPSENRLGQ